MAKAFRWNGPGILTDTVGGKAVAHMGRRTDEAGRIVEGDIVREHTIDAKKLDDWVKAGVAEYVGPVENIAGRITGQPGQSADGKKESERLQAIVEQQEATARITVLGEIRTLMASPLFTDDERREADAEIATVPADRLAEVLEDTKFELERRQKAAEKPKDPPAPPAGNGPKPDAKGAGPK